MINGAPWVYLVGPIAGLTFKEAVEWRDFATSEFNRYGINCRYPVLNSIVPDSAGRFNATGYPDLPHATQDAIVGSDRWSVRNSDIILANFIGARRASIGSVCELAWADTFKVPVCSILDLKDTENPHIHSFVQKLSTWITPHLVEGIQIIADVLTGNLPIQNKH